MRLIYSLMLVSQLAVHVPAALGDEARQPTDAPRPGEKMHLYLLIGQSNMAGRGNVGEADKKPHPRVFALSKEGKWVAAVDPIHFDKPVAGVGPGLSFGKSMAKANPKATIGLIPCAAGGSPIEVWKKGGYWKQTKSKPYDDMVRRVAGARKHGELKGILWHQGESDSNEKNAPEHAKKLVELMTRIRRELKAPDVPILVGGMSDPFKARNAHARTVDQALRDLPKTLDRSAYVSAAMLTLKSDRIHFDAASERELGRRYAKEMLRMHKKSRE